MVAVPSFVSANARRGLKLLDNAGDGLKPQTVREARQMASGSISADKVRRMAAWLARHESDLGSDDAQAYVSGTRDRPTPGQVAWLLWGGDLGSAQRDRARLWAERKRDQLINDGDLSKAISGKVREGLQNKVIEHNDAVGNVPSKRVTLGMLSAVFERGIGAYATNPSSVRPTVSSPEQWAYARVNAFLGAVRSGRYRNGKFDTDLLPEGHPLTTRKIAKEIDMNKGYGYEMKDDDEMYDPLDSLLNAYSAAVKLGPVTDKLLGKMMTVINAVREMYVEDTMTPDMGMNKSTHYTNPVACLIHAYLGLLNTDRADLRADVMALVHEAEAIVYADGNAMDQGSNMADQSGGDMVTVDDSAHEPYLVQRSVREENGQYCVYSTTGRSFGCYTSQAEALDRLAQIEWFSAAKLVQASLETLVDWHDDCHSTKSVTPALKLVHDIIEDTLELRGHARPYDLTLDDKIDLMISKSTGVVSKADEQRYTLGPWYVPNVEDAHGEFTDDDTLQIALWDWVRKGDRTIYLQHGDKAAGEMVEILTVPFPVEADLTVPNQGTTRYQFPANTPFMGVVWESWAWDLVKAGKLRGYSIGGTARRMTADLPVDALV